LQFGEEATATTDTRSSIMEDDDELDDMVVIQKCKLFWIDYDKWR
jgi:hypothetical protein